MAHHDGEVTVAVPRTAHAAMATVAAFVTFAVWLLSGVSDPQTVKAIDGLAFVALGLVYVPLAALGARKAHGTVRTAWVLIAIALSGWLVGEILRGYYEIVAHRPPFPSPADAAYLIFPPLVCAALLHFPGQRRWPSRTRLILDGVIVACAFFVISWLLVMRTVYYSGGQTQLELVVALAYQAGDVMMMTICVLVLAQSAAELRAMLTLLVAGLTCVTLADCARLYLQSMGMYDTGHFIDIIRFCGVLLIIMALVEGYHSRCEDEPAQVNTGWVSLWLPYVPLTAALIFVAGAPLHIVMEPPVLGAGMVLTIAVFGRQLLEATTTRLMPAPVSDVTERDPLTGLANRARFSDYLSKAMQSHKNDNVPVAVIALDLNDFKAVNDALGQPAGDELLRRAAERIHDCVRPSDTLARTGGDEFTILIEGRIDSAYMVAHRVVEAFEKPFSIAGSDLTIRPSVGLAVATAEDAGLSADELLTRADIAMSAAKRTGSQSVHGYSPELDLANTADFFKADTAPTVASRSGPEVVHLLAELRQAFTNGQLDLVYQPQVELATTRIVGLEALLRWSHPEHGMLGPDEFLPLVRRYGLMRSITDFVIARALDDARRWRDAGIDLPVAVNMFAPSLTDLELPDRFARALAERDLASTTLVIEITEDLLLNVMARTRAVLDDLRGNGIRISIDDFGTGYSALSYLRDLPVDEVKLDRNFIAPITADQRAAVVVRGVIDLAHSLNLTVVAEGVEDTETIWMLRDFGCDVAQGYHLSPPLPLTELLDLLHAGTINPASQSLRTV